MTEVEQIDRRASNRADARRNRERILEAGHAVFEADDGASMQAVARRAGVGQATLYRNFPTKDALLVELYRQDFDDLLKSASTLLAALGPEAGLRGWLDHLAAFGRRKRVLSTILDAAVRAELHDDQRRPLLDKIEILLAAGRSVGAVRADVVAEDVLLLVDFAWLIEVSPERVEHLLDLVTQALRPRI